MIIKRVGGMGGIERAHSIYLHLNYQNIQALQEIGERWTRKENEGLDHYFFFGTVSDDASATSFIPENQQYIM